MKKLRITVADKVYDVTVQVLEDDEQAVSGAGFLNPLPAPPHVRPPAAAAPPPTPAPHPRAGAVDPNAIAAPIAGTVQKLYVHPGTHVEAKTPVVLLDAMKMDTYIYAPRSGEVAEVCVAAGDAVQVGEVLLRYKPEP